MENQNDSSVCCPLFKPEKWDKKSFTWTDMKFIKETIPEFFHIPSPNAIDKKITKMWSSIEKTDAMLENKDDTLILFHDPTPFRGEIFIAVSKEVPNENNVVLSGNFVSRVYDGGYNDISRFIKDMNSYLAESQKKAKDFYIHYAYCPKCAEKYGHNYMIIFAEV